MKKLVAGEGDWTCVKDVPGWILDTEAETDTLSKSNTKEIPTLVNILATYRRMGQKEIEHLVWKLRSMKLAVPGAVDHLFHIQRTLNQGGVDRS